ncbi:hypothetical protein PQA73_gp57 [Erwinia phage Pavtok]|uniref:Uncharacterized protein n=1 Tax=Erwinia phage Pavtok TaxID=2267655 RepID=A0A345BM14_9CAUD|nr:hypothetical protein PQA73_gp57 [Erwinia phage Pavtok]AXF51485.1 hypothetical protein PAVTOK_57 [Erwinia phage Pavtok]
MRFSLQSIRYNNSAPAKGLEPLPMTKPQPIITAVQIREYVRQQNVAPEAAPGLKMLMQAAQQIDQFASAAVQWQDQSNLVHELQARLAAAQQEDEQAKPSHDMQQLVDEACVMFGIETYDDFLPKLANVQSLMTRQNEALMHRDQQIEASDVALNTANELIAICAATVNLPLDAEPQAIVKAIEDAVTGNEGLMEGKQEYARVHELMTQACEATQIPEIRFDQLPRQIMRIMAIVNECAEATGTEEDVTELPDRVRKYVKYADENRDAIDRLQRELQDHAVVQRDDTRAALNRIGLALGLTAPTVQEVLDAIETLYGTDNVSTPAVDETWLNDVIDLCHAVAGDLSRENRIMARTARSLIQTAPRGEHDQEA